MDRCLLGRRLLDPVGKQPADAIINNFNFGYVYDFFFDPEKSKGNPTNRCVLLITRKRSSPSQHRNRQTQHIRSNRAFLRGFFHH
jgi:hypothetical protein